MIKKVKVDVFLKESIFDPQGQVIKNALHNLKHTNVHEVRTGKSFVLNIDIDKSQNIDAIIKKISNDVLSNPVIEKFEYTLL